MIYSWYLIVLSGIYCQLYFKNQYKRIAGYVAAALLTAYACGGCVSTGSFGSALDPSNGRLRVCKPREQERLAKLVEKEAAKQEVEASE